MSRKKSVYMKRVFRVAFAGDQVEKTDETILGFPVAIVGLSDVTGLTLVSHIVVADDEHDALKKAARYAKEIIDVGWERRVISLTQIGYAYID